MDKYRKRTLELSLKPAGMGWEITAARMGVVHLSWLAALLVPSLTLTSIPRRTRGISFYPGKIGFSLGAMLVSGSATLGWLLGGPYRLEGAGLGLWLLGSTGAVMMVSAVRPFAFVKPICVGCRLLPVIKEHEAMHLAGVSGEDQVWSSMRERHSADSLRLEGDPAICSFCPIPKRLSEH